LDATKLDITTRVVNDMKSIMSEQEFLKMVAQIYAYRVARTATRTRDEKEFKPRRGFKKGKVRF